ncbi:MFS transporter [Acidithiobacillus thiooxidans]|uniref:MFS transporter n=1 Tax=Acidithiobacillus thiooxidans TaxID=930 RepID=UPI0028592727|nr:MFS transporter [Acidithiobacillus thiooxidans]MDR7926063.1 MFS transporter [Acidithiobacillus thiooxidans]
MMTSRRYASKMTLLSVCFGLFMIQLDLTVVNVALKSIQDNLHADVAALQWVVDAYAILFSSLMLTTGDLGDIFGRRRIYTSGMVLFVLGSIACASAPSYVFLIVARSLQGIGAAAVLPNSLAILRNAFPDARLRARAIGWWAGVSGLAVVAGPTLGGWLVGTFGWRSVFWINVPVGVLGLWLILGFVSESSHPQGRKLDIWGQVLAASALASLIFAVIEGQSLGWGNILVIVVFAWAVMSGVVLYVFEQRHAHPMLDFRFFRQPIFTAANAASGLMNFGVFATLFAFSLYLLHIQQLSPEQVGLRLVVMFAPFALSLPFGGRITGHFGSRYPAALGLGATGAGMLLLCLVPLLADDVLMFLALFIIGLGLAAATPALVSAAIGALPPERSGAASAFNNTSRQAGGALGVALLGGLVGVGASLSSEGVVTAIFGSAVALLLGSFISWRFIHTD